MKGTREKEARVGRQKFADRRNEELSSYLVVHLASEGIRIMTQKIVGPKPPDRV